MNGRLTGSIALSAFVLVVSGAGATALAQEAPAPAVSGAPAPAAAAPAVAAPAAATPAPGDSSTPAPAGAATAAPAASAAPKPEGVVTGYAYREHKGHGAPRAEAPVTHHPGRLAHHANEATAKVSGFEMLADGGSRLFVQLSRQVDVDQAKDMAADEGFHHGKHAHSAKQAPRAALTRLTYVLKGTELARANDENSLETMHFNTPIVRARLVPAGRDVRFVVLLRADVTPTMKTVAAKDGGSILQIDFPQGSYVASAANEAMPSPGAPSDTNGSPAAVDTP